MSLLEDEDEFYAAGRKLAEHIADSKGMPISVATLQALVKDILPQHGEPQEALRSIVARPDFIQIVQLASSGKGHAQRCAFAESLREIYSEKTVIVAESLACGIMGLSMAKIQYESSVHALQSAGSGTHFKRQSKGRTRKNYIKGMSRYHETISQVVLGSAVVFICIFIRLYMG